MFGFFSFYSFLIIALTILYGIYDYRGKEEFKERSFYLGCFVLLFFAASRGESVGGDLAEYIPLFHGLNDSSITEIFMTSLMSGYEIGFVLLCKLINLISDESRFFIIVTSICSLLGPFFLVVRYSENKWYSILMYPLLSFYTISLNNVRQAIAISIIMFAIHFLLQQRKLSFLCCVVIASFMHTSAVFSLLFYPLTRWQYSFKKVVFLITSLLVVFFLLGSFLFNYMLANVFTRYLNETGDSYTETGTGYGLLVVYIFIVAICLVLFQKGYADMDSQSYNINKLFLLSVIAAVFIQAFASYMAALSRLVYYFYLPIIVLLPNLIGNIRKTPVRRLLFIAMFLFFYGLASFTFLSPVGESGMNSTDTIPYVFLNGVFSW